MTRTATETIIPLDDSVKGKLDPEYVDFYNKYICSNLPIVLTHTFPVDFLRSNGNVMPGQSDLLPVMSTQNIIIPRKHTKAPTGVSVRIFQPHGDAPEGGWPCLLWFHGGGWVLGNINTENSFATHMCEQAKCVVVNVDYRLAPENPFPACIEDGWETLLYCYEAANVLGINPKKIAVGGSSAGGNISAVLSHSITSSSFDYPPLVLQLLVVPVCDNTASAESHTSWKLFENTPQLPAAKMLWYRKHYLPDEKDWNNPKASPFFYAESSFRKVCPALICAAGCDVLSTEAVQYHEKLLNAGVKSNIKVYEGCPHPVMAMDAVLRKGRILNKDATDALLAAFS
ncbi:esterase/lipase, implicated in cellular detoxification [Schizosaccharomyces osmophilus]|uniref:Esterase/lipase, implicated in cellular detoxification n=1 Tax=Schizosaccharomyces osmophilus TaxID=2545709 RepID=A0AAE9W5X7_9SCHI|nr:esterase/lipase, implicated in cellular detoxification [Schizosaccharomyces osmophilus]WBW70634.1 esterase/lipase, implicated in cellular detoxification [Schizosaccharomyces osmophilus]